jgi:hypothetical protein
MKPGSKLYKSLSLRATCALAATVWLPVTMAQTPQDQAPVSAVKPSAAQGMPMQRVVIDPVTGKVRLPEHDEVDQAGPSAGASSARSAAPQAAAGLQSHPAMQRMLSTQPTARFGTVAQRMDADSLSFTVARRNADGSLDTTCVAGEDAATHAMHAAPAQGGSNDR